MIFFQDILSACSVGDDEKRCMLCMKSIDELISHVHDAYRDLSC